jgi:hypothetical protein
MKEQARDNFFQAFSASLAKKAPPSVNSSAIHLKRGKADAAIRKRP